MFYKKGKFFTIEFKDTAFAVLTALFYAALLVPIYRLALYTTPFYDDYNYAMYVKDALNTHTFASVLKGAWTAMTWTWATWQGTYFSVFLMSLMPATFGNAYYYIGVWAVLTMLVAGSLFLAYSVARSVFLAKRPISLAFAVLFSFAVVENLYAPQQSLFWYNAAVHYTFMTGLLMLWLGCMVRLFFAEKHRILLEIACTILAFLVAGANFVTTLQGILLAAALLLAAIIWKKKPLWMIAPLVSFTVGFLINVSAPGNERRQAFYEGVAKGPLESIFRSVLSGVSYIPEFSGLIIIAYLLILAPVIAKMVKETKFWFSYPGLVSVFAFLFYSTGFVAGYYGMGVPGIARIFAATKSMFLVMLFGLEVYWIGWWQKKQQKKNRETNAHHYVLYYAACFVMLVLCVCVSKAKVESFLSYGSYYYVHTGEAECYRNEFNARVDAIENGGDYVEVDPFIYRPWFLCQQEDLDTDYQAEQNVAMARWYGKAGIALKSEE